MESYKCCQHTGSFESRSGALSGSTKKDPQHHAHGQADARHDVYHRADEALTMSPRPFFMLTFTHCPCQDTPNCSRTQERHCSACKHRSATGVLLCKVQYLLPSPSSTAGGCGWPKPRCCGCSGQSRTLLPSMLLSLLPPRRSTSCCRGCCHRAVTSCNHQNDGTHVLLSPCVPRYWGAPPWHTACVDYAAYLGCSLHKLPEVYPGPAAGYSIDADGFSPGAGGLVALLLSGHAMATPPAVRW